jgi:hypothetical protein
MWVRVIIGFLLSSMASYGMSPVAVTEQVQRLVGSKDFQQKMSEIEAKQRYYLLLLTMIAEPEAIEELAIICKQLPVQACECQIYEIIRERMGWLFLQSLGLKAEKYALNSYEQSHNTGCKAYKNIKKDFEQEFQRRYNALSLEKTIEIRNKAVVEVSNLLLCSCHDSSPLVDI